MKMPDKKPETSHSKAGGENIGRFIHIWRNVVENSLQKVQISSSQLFITSEDTCFGQRDILQICYWFLMKNISGWFHFPKIKLNKGSVICTQCKIHFTCTTRGWHMYSKCNKNYTNFRKIKSKQLLSSSLSVPSAISIPIHFPVGWSML